MGTPTGEPVVLTEGDVWMPPFGGKKAAPFKKGGGRKTSSPRKANGQKRRRKGKGK